MAELHASMHVFAMTCCAVSSSRHYLLALFASSSSLIFPSIHTYVLFIIVLKIGSCDDKKNHLVHIENLLINCSNKLEWHSL